VHRAWPVLLLVAAALGACGEHRTPPPVLTDPIGRSAGTQTLRYPAAGLVLRVPRGWYVVPGTPPMVMTATSGLAVVTVWRYPRTEPLPRTRRALRLALNGLLGAVRARDSTFRLESSKVLSLAHRPAVQVVGEETVDGQPRRVRSEHIYAFGAETVIDALAPVGQFRAVNQQVFVRMLRGVRVGRPS